MINFSPNDVQWVLTIPATWTPGAKQFMRETAYQVMLKYHVLSSSKWMPPNLESGCAHNFIWSLFRCANLMANRVVTFNSACLFFIDFTTSFRFVFRFANLIKKSFFFKRPVWDHQRILINWWSLWSQKQLQFSVAKNLSDFQAEIGSRPVDGILSQINTHNHHI